MKKTLAMILILVMGLTAGLSTAEAAATPKVFAFDMANTNISETDYDGPTDGFISVVRRVEIVLDNWSRAVSPYGGTLYYDSSVKFARVSKVFKNGKIPDGTLGGVIRLDGSATAVIPTNIRTWDDFRKHVIGLPEGVANSSEPPTEWPLATRTNIVQASSPNQAAATILAELKEALPELEIAVSKEIANATARYISEVTAGKVKLYQIAYGSPSTGFNAFFVEKASEKWAEWEGYIGDATAAAEYVISKTAPKKN